MRCVQGHTPCNYILNLLGSSRQAHISEKKINSIGECRNRIAFSIRLLNLMSLVCHTHNVGCIRELWNNLASGEVRWIKKKKCPWLLNPSVPVFGPIMLQFAEGCFWQLCDISSLEQHKYISAKRCGNVLFTFCSWLEYLQRWCWVRSQRGSKKSVGNWTTLSLDVPTFYTPLDTLIQARNLVTFWADVSDCPALDIVL